MATKYKTICMQAPEFEQLSQAKAQYETDTSQHVDWGKFLLVLGIAYLISKALQRPAAAPTEPVAPENVTEPIKQGKPR